MARQRQEQVPSISEIEQDGGLIASGGQRGRGGNNQERAAAPRLQPVHERDEGVSGDRERSSPQTYFAQHTLPTLRNIVGHLSTTDSEHFTIEQEGHYNRVITELANKLEAEKTALLNVSDEAYLRQVGGTDLTTKIKQAFEAQLLKPLVLVDVYESENQQKAVLAYAELLLDGMNGATSIDLNALGDRLHQLGLDQGQAEALGRVFTEISNHVEPNFSSFARKILDTDAYYIEPALSDLPELQLDSQAVSGYLAEKVRVSEGTYRVFIDTLDGLDPQSQEAQSQNPEVVLSIDDPLMGWQDRVGDRRLINACLGNEKFEIKLFGTQVRHENKHVIENVRHKAPIRKEGIEFERLADVEAIEITLKSTVYQGEWSQGRTLEPGQSVPEDFLNKLVEVTVWSVALDSANKVENLHDQLMAAEAVTLGLGMKVTQTLGRYEGSTDREVLAAKAFRIPVLNHRGEPNFIVVDKETLLDMQKVCTTSRRSYAKLAQEDSRYGVADKATRWANFQPQLQEHRNSSENWVDEERDMIKVERLSRARISALQEAGGEANEFMAHQLNDALGEYTRRFNEFQTHCFRPSHYREFAIARLGRRGMEANAPEFQQFLSREINAVAIEYANRWNVFRNITARVMSMRSQEGATEAEILAMNAELDAFLANIDRELEIQTRTASTDVSRERVGQEFEPVRRSLSPQPIADAATTVSPAEVIDSIVMDSDELLEQQVDTQPSEVADTVEVEVGPEVKTVQDVFKAAIFGAMENHNDSGYAWNVTVPQEGYDARNFIQPISRILGDISPFVQGDLNTSRAAFIELGQDNLPPDKMLVGLKISGLDTDSTGRHGILSGELVLPIDIGRSLKKILLERPEELVSMIELINGGPLLTTSKTGIERVKFGLGAGLSVYSAATDSVEAEGGRKVYVREVVPFAQPPVSS